MEIHTESRPFLSVSAIHSDITLIKNNMTTQASKGTSFLSNRSFLCAIALFMVITASPLAMGSRRNSKQGGRLLQSAAEVAASASFFTERQGINEAEGEGCCVPDGAFDPTRDYFPTKVQSEFSQDWTVEYERNYKLVTIGDGESAQRIVLVQCGTPAPALAQLPPEFATGDVKVLTVPTTRISLSETITVTFFEMLQAREVLKGISSYTTSPCVWKQVDSGNTSVIPIGLELNVSTYGNTSSVFPPLAEQAEQNAENYLDLAIFSTFYYSRSEEIAALPFSIGEGSSSDPGIIERLEWIEFFSLFLNGESRAQDTVSNARERIEEAHQLVQTIMQSSGAKSAVFLQHFGQFGGWTPSFSEYIVGSNGVFGLLNITNRASEFTSNITDPEEGRNIQMYTLLCEMDVIYFSIFNLTFFESYVQDWSQWFEEAILNGTVCPVLEDERIYSNDLTLGPNGGNDFFESNLARGDDFVWDMLWATYQEFEDQHQEIRDHERRWIRNFISEQRQTLTADNCTDEEIQLGFNYLVQCQVELGDESNTASGATRVQSLFQLP